MTDRKFAYDAPPIDENRRYPIEVAAEWLSVSRAHLFKRIASGHVRTVQDGRRMYVLGSELVRYSRKSTET